MSKDQEEGYALCAVEDLRSMYSDYYKDVFGCRPLCASLTREELINCLDELDLYMGQMEATEEGREKLRADGWLHV